MTHLPRTTDQENLLGEVLGLRAVLQTYEGDGQVALIPASEPSLCSHQTISLLVHNNLIIQV